ncbi:MAG TPA: zf-HC2 domain-containing protein [Parafilimonas sp.]|nr:zf-HC2 domain-containing protein [Parafilimonas sp.]
MKEVTMQCYEAESLLIDYLDNQLHPGDKVPLEQHLQGCPSCRQTLEEYRTLFATIESDKAEKPGPALREKFENMLQSEINVESTARIVEMEKERNDRKIIPLKRTSILFRIAASIVLIASGIFIGSFFIVNRTNGNDEVADLKNEVNEMKETLMFNGLTEESASERIKAVSYADDMHDPDNKIVTALINTMNEDKNVNVRLAALYAIAKFSDNSAVTNALIASLSKQTEPLMQIALINILTEKKETKAKEPIKQILQDKNTLPPVKEIAQKGLQLL